MSTDSEREIHHRLGEALGTITPPSPPVDVVLGQGRTIRTRRRVAVGAGLAVVVGLGIALPGLVGHTRAAPPVQPSFRMTVNPTRDTPRKLTFSGAINGKPWRFDVGWNRGDIVQSGPGAAENIMGNMPLGGQPGSFDEPGLGSGADAQLIIVGRVRGDVSYLALNEPGGQVVYVSPVPWHGQRWIGVAIPARLRLRSVVAYSDRGELAYAVPFTDNTVNVWLKPGQRGLARQTARIATGVLDGKRWSYEGYAGPWGVCFRTSVGNGSCLEAYGSRLRPGHFISWLVCGSFEDAGSQLWNGQAAPDVRYLKFRLSDGSVQRVLAVPLAGYRYFAVAFAGHQHLTGWTAYEASGQVLGSGSVSPKC